MAALGPRSSSNALRVSLALGVLYAVHLYGLLGAVSYPPVNIVILVFYLHPLMVGVIAILCGREAVPWHLWCWSLPSGLEFAVDSIGNLNWIGMALALTAAMRPS